MKLGFTIILNGAHHLLHNDYAEYLADTLDHWAIVEGAALPGGSTSWCKDTGDAYHRNGRSKDDTVDILTGIAKRHKNIHLRLSAGPWESKDAMVNAAADMLRAAVSPDARAHVFQIDIDEQWTAEQMEEAIHNLGYMDAECGEFLCDHYVGPGLLARGEWGEGHRLPYVRLWKWQPGFAFDTHEPPKLRGGNHLTVLLPQRFKHLAYYFEQDVAFKNDYYSGHEGILERWRGLQTETSWPQPISRLITGPWGKTLTYIQPEEGGR
jgi:hypothetical protein